ncbi:MULTISPECIES: FecR family protein [Olivibacter]|uniref:FecR family protein n=1 Tax=Olivibacter oleidegradans TaxID=760123 RepID=A0ABV6HJ80_9SPHI|nr:FecR family protein [Olivibacter jilunii]
MDIKKAEQILDKYLSGHCTVKEKQTVEEWFDVLPEEELQFDTQNKDRLAKNMKVQIDRKSKRNTVKVWSLNATRWMTAALFLLFVGMGTYLYLNQQPQKKKQQIVQHDVDPGGAKATLLLANGTEIDLTDATKGQLTEEDGIRISKTDDGQLVYKIVSRRNESKKTTKSLSYNEIRTPKGGKYKVILPDSSCVWLNAASSLRYPTRFDDKIRRVELKGEGYFEVYKNKGQVPFIVTTATQQLEVLGTHFNINGYMDESTVKTTLIEGKVRVYGVNEGSTTHLEPKTLIPGQQSQISTKGIQITKVEVAEAVAWKDNFFYFKGTDLTSVMRQLERWYDIEVDYESLPKRKLRGKIPRNVKLSTVLKTIEETSNLEFHWQGRRLMVE